MGKKKKEKGFVLNKDRLNLSDTVKQDLDSWAFRNMGKVFVGQGLNQSDLLVNTTGSLGFINGIYYGTMFEAAKDGFKSAKIKDSVYVNPIHKGFFDLILGQKEQLEQKIKQGLVGISQSIADLELVEHDIRVYKQYKEYLDMLDSDDEDERRKAELSLKTIFVDQVDFHVGSQGGQGGPGRLSMAFMRNNNIMPTIVDDFMEIKSIEDVRQNSQNQKLMYLPTVEKRMLEVKYNSYLDWLSDFNKAVRERLSRLESLHKSRLKTVEEYKEWLKPTIARHKLISDALESEGGRKDYKTMPYDISTSASSFNSISVWLWKGFVQPNDRPASADKIFSKINYNMDDAGFRDPLHPFNYWTQENLIFNHSEGLVADYPWITKEWAYEKAGKYVKELSADRFKIYYNFITMDIGKANFKIGNSELEDGDFLLNCFILSYNAMLAKLLEKDAIQEEFEMYVNDVIGIPHHFSSGDSDYPHLIINYVNKNGKYLITEHCIDGLKKARKYFPDHNLSDELLKWAEKPHTLKEIKERFPENKFHYVRIKEESSLNKWLKSIGLEFNIFRTRSPGPYENIFLQRITKFYFITSGKAVSKIKGMILKRISNLPGAD